MLALYQKHLPLYAKKQFASHLYYICNECLEMRSYQLILCLLTCMAYLVTLSIDMMCTRVSFCDNCVAISWFICILILFISFVVAVPVSQLRASSRKGSKLLLQW